MELGNQKYVVAQNLCRGLPGIVMIYVGTKETDEGIGHIFAKIDSAGEFVWETVILDQNLVVNGNNVYAADGKYRLSQHSCFPMGTEQHERYVDLISRMFGEG